MVFGRMKKLKEYLRVISLDILGGLVMIGWIFFNIQDLNMTLQIVLPMTGIALVFRGLWILFLDKIENVKYKLRKQISSILDRKA